MWTQVQISVQVTMDVARWHASTSWLDDPGLEPVVLTRTGVVRVHPYEDPVSILDACCEALRKTAAEQDWLLS